MPDSFSHGVLTIRHGITPWNADHRWQGWADVSLSEVGHRQAEAGSYRLQQLLDHVPNHQLRIVTSDLGRARQTAEWFSKRLGVAISEEIPGLRERNVGAWSGKTTREINERWPGMLDAWREGNLERTPEGESEAEFSARILAELHRLTEDAERLQHVIVAVAHGGVIRTLERRTGIGSEPIGNVTGRWFHRIGEELHAGEAVDLLEGGDHERTAGTAL